MRETVKMEVMSIVHGKSEYNICSSIKSNLRLKHEIIARKRGQSSIQVTSIMKVLQDRRFINFRNFVSEFTDVEHKKGRLLNFFLFIIMDVDDCTPEQRENFINKKMFENHWLYDYIIPIYNIPNLESTMMQAKIKIERKRDYIVVFPTNHGDLDIDIAKDYLKKIKSCKCSNLDKYIQYCVSLAEKNM